MGRSWVVGVTCGSHDVWVGCGIDCIDYVTGIGNAHAHNGVHSVLSLG